LIKKTELSGVITSNFDEPLIEEYVFSVEKRYTKRLIIIIIS